MQQTPEPITVSVKNAGEMLGPDSMSPALHRYSGRTRLVNVESIRAYAKSLPTERPDVSA